ncbi:ATP-dependent RecD-like DNA helicase [Methanocorpusculaceae archaeon Sp1]|nr:ATP-dependent RecD-like DNA helicase [Methanocorpusculaceae archaeon Sp1]
MDNVCKDIFRAIHEGKWLNIKYRNKRGEIRWYWIGIKDINPINKMLTVDGLSLSKYAVSELHIFIDSILTTFLIDGSYQPINHELVNDIDLNPHKYQGIFHNVANLKILNYLSDCYQLDTTPYHTDYALIQRLDRDTIPPAGYRLNNEQFREVVEHFHRKSSEKQKQSINRLQQLCINVLSINTRKGLYVLAYRRLQFNVNERTLIPEKQIVICREFQIDGVKKSIRLFLDAEDHYLLDDFETNQELIKDRIIASNPNNCFVDDLPYIIAIGRDLMVDLDHEYAAIVEMYEQNTVTTPIKAFFGNLLERPRRKKLYPPALLNKRVNLDQLLAINTAMKYPVTYVQGPPGTGKTNTIINTISTAFFNDRTVLFSSYNNHPIDGVFEKLGNITYRDANNKILTVPFPIIRLGNNEKVWKATEYINRLFRTANQYSFSEKSLEENKAERMESAEKLAELLKKHDEFLDLNEKKEAILQLISINTQSELQNDLSKRQLRELDDEIARLGTITNEDALNLLTDDENSLRKYFFYTSIKFIKRLAEPKYDELRKILDVGDKDQRIAQFNRYLSNDENFEKFLRIFPIIVTTCISAHKLGDPKPYFDMVIIDESSQCNTAISLIPIIRGETLMLVGDPQQLNPVILLDPKDNDILKEKYSVTKEYDYITNSIYKTYLSCDAVSDEILLSYHYRCHKKIIEFNNKKYYNNKLKIMTASKEDPENPPLVFWNIRGNTTDYKNTAPSEVDKILRYALENPNKSIGVITPFTNQRDLIQRELETYNLGNVTCGTVHAFQGDEKDVVIFSLAITDKTQSGTYNWLQKNDELTNVAVSRAKEKFILLGDETKISSLHQDQESDNIYELVQYVKTEGTSEVSAKAVNSRALGIKPYSSQTEEAFLTTLNQALSVIPQTSKTCQIRKEVSISQVFTQNFAYNDLFYSGRFDFVVYERKGKQEYPVLAIELDGREHYDQEIVMNRDRKKEDICRQHGFELIRVDNSYARRYNYIKGVLIDYFSNVER